MAAGRGASAKKNATPTYARIYATVARIPAGRVATYGQIAKLAGFPKHARMVGYALNALTDHDEVPWHRVLNAAGTISPRAEPLYGDLQHQLLRGEGVTFDAAGRVPLARFQWKPRHRSPSGTSVRASKPRSRGNGV